MYDAVIERQVGKNMKQVVDPRQSEEDRRRDEDRRYRYALGYKNAAVYPHSWLPYLNCADLAWLSETNRELQMWIDKELALRQEAQANA